MPLNYNNLPDLPGIDWGTASQYDFDRGLEKYLEGVPKLQREMLSHGYKTKFRNELARRRDVGSKEAEAKGEEQSANYEEYLKSLEGYKTPQTDINRNLNVMGQQLAAGQGRDQRAFSQRFAARTGGRLGSTERGQQAIGGQYALAGQQGSASILNQAATQEFQMQQAHLQAYTQKYGWDQRAAQEAQRLNYAYDQLALQRELGLKQIKAQKDAQSSGWGEFLGGVIPFGYEVGQNQKWWK